LSRSIRAREAVNASPRWPVAAATITAASPIASEPTRWTAATAGTSYSSATAAQTSRSWASAVGCAD
jgi:hypothetical protein